MRAIAYRAAGGTSFLIGLVGVAVPLLPSVPFMILAAYCFGKGSPDLERRLLMHPSTGPHIIRWRDQKQISRSAKRAAYAGFACSGSAGLVFLEGAIAAVPVVACVGGSLWIWSREEPASEAGR